MTRPKKPPVEGAALLDKLRDILRTYVILQNTESYDAVALWIAATHALPAWHCAPRLVIRAPEKRCGKSRLLDVAEAGSHNPLATVNASVAAIIRSIGSDDPPTLLIDEYDTVFTRPGDNDDLRGLVNAGHQRGKPALRYDPNSGRVEKLQTFGMVGMAGIGPAPDTIEDRAVVIHMRRRRKGEQVQPWRIMRDRPIVATLGTELHDWLSAHLDELRDAVPVMPVEDRDADTWEPLITVADLAGGNWPIRARTACLTLTGAREETAATSDRVRLLADIRDIFTTAGPDIEALPFSHIMDRLRTLDESPWAELSAHKFGALLREFQIKSANIRFPTGQAKGYRREDFIDAWGRYCDPAAPAGPGQASQASQASQPSSEAGRFPEWDASKRPTISSVPGLTSDGTLGTLGTLTPLEPGQGPAHGRHLRAVPPPNEATGTE